MTDILKSLSFQSLFDISTDAMLLINEASHITLANLAALHLLGYAEADIRGIQIESLLARDNDRRHFQMAYSQRNKSHPMGNGTKLVVVKRNGKELAVKITLYEMQAEEVCFTLIMLCAIDRRHQTEEALRVSEERLRLAKQAAGLGVFDFDSDQNILHWDSRMRELWGAETDQDITYKQFITAIHPEDRATRQSALDRAVDPASKGAYNAEYRVTNPIDGAERWVSVVGRMHFEEGHATRLVGVARDISEQKMFEKKLQEQRAETETLFTQQVAAQTVSAIAHELNQPLAAISAYSEVALHALQEDTINPDNLKRALKGCVDQSQRAGKCLHELLAFLQKGNLVRTKLNINDVVKEALSIAKSNGYGAFNPKLYLEQNIPPVTGSKIQILKVLVNLLTNAVEAMSGATVLTSTITITARTNQDMNMAHVTVQDSGPGLDHDTAQRVFEPFFTTKPTGIGMGLAISRALTEENGGQLWLEPSAEHATKTGATFHFTLPFAL